MARDRCLHVCLLGDAGIGQSSFLRCYAEAKEAIRDDSSRDEIDVFLHPRSEML